MFPLPNPAGHISTLIYPNQLTLLTNRAQRSGLGSADPDPRNFLRPHMTPNGEMTMANWCMAKDRIPIFTYL